MNGTGEAIPSRLVQLTGKCCQGSAKAVFGKSLQNAEQNALAASEDGAEAIDEVENMHRTG
jgi:hypothetical protein